jgi:hypothetical protein
MITEMKSYSGYMAEERPERFVLAGEEIVVHRILSRWRDQNYDCFRVIDPAGMTYLLCYDRQGDIWRAERRQNNLNKESGMDTGQFRKRTRLIQERRHDPFRERGKWPEPTVCSVCNALFQNGRWSWGEIQANANKVVCPACQRIAETYPAGYVEIKGAFFDEHREELLNMIRNEEAQEKGEHPMERIMSIAEEKEGVLVTTTGIHLARRIGDALARAYQGDLSFQYSDDEQIIRVNWNR